MGIEGPRPNKLRDTAQKTLKGVQRMGRVALAAGMIAASGPSIEEADAKVSQTYVEQLQKKTLSKLEKEYLTQNVYQEGRGEGVKGQLAIAQVTIKRLASGRYGKDLEKVIFALNQFSWTSDPRILLTEMNKETYEKIETVLWLYVGKPLSEAVQSLSEASGIPASAEFYKRTDWDEDNPEETRMSERTKKMFRSLVKVGTIDHHTFYALSSAEPKQKETKN